ncbi:MAG: PPOX class F420-dependent oxidoreductase [Aigarchaeota archaeon]|nr:PPOX class F420-dependent oxidoreductase [Aigarchaeota archaeon]MCX8192682.1 PPOX class F420-dependent oxidoreductase [Nitrososphaeria archaeon]MDW7985641.1 PPOX class F420-dependent oxidoreductase [Nitrososphaerota archaeon]
MTLSNQLKEAKFICLETYKRSGEPVRTPVWFTVENGLIYFHTSSKSGKVKRLRRNPSVRVAPCSRFGRITGDWFKGEALMVEGEESKRLVELINSRLGLIDKIISLFHRKNRIVFRIRLEDC